MATIKATCPSCGEVAFTSADVELRVDRSDPDRSYYQFDCPGCGDAVRKPADHRVVQLLASGDVPVLELAPLVRLSERFNHPPLTRDHLLELHEALQDDGWIDRLVGIR